MKAPRSGNDAWHSLRDDANASGEPIVPTPPLHAKDCGQCVCRVCWAVSGFNAQRCAACSESGCRVGRERAAGCASWLDAELRAGRVVRTSNTTPPDTELLRDITASVAAQDTASAAPEALPHRLHAWAATFADELADGRVALLDVIDAALEDALDDGLPPCPVCGHVVRPGQSGFSLGLCRRCWLERLTDAHNAAYRELVAEREYNVAKQRVRRLRDSLDPTRERGREPFRRCAVCGSRLPSIARHPEDLCSDCLAGEGAGDGGTTIDMEAQAAGLGPAGRDGQEPRTAHNPQNPTP